jgi:hypothetical protein
MTGGTMAKRRIPNRSELLVSKDYNQEWWDDLLPDERAAYTSVLNCYRLSKQDNGAHSYVLKDELEKSGWIYKGGTND